MVYSVAILEPSKGRLTNMLRDRLLLWEDAPSVLLTRGTQFSDFRGSYDLFAVLSADFTAKPPSADLSCRALLLSGDVQGALVLQIASQWAVSFGLSVKDSITVSSVAPDTAVLALQRELVTLEHQVLEQQEIPLAVPQGTSAAGMMALTGCLLLLGMPPEKLRV